MNTDANTETLVKTAIIQTLNLSSIQSIENHMELKNDLGMDSMSMLTLMMNLEHSIQGFTIDPSEFNDDDFFSINTVIDHVDKQLQEKAKAKA